MYIYEFKILHQRTEQNNGTEKLTRIINQKRSHRFNSGLSDGMGSGTTAVAHTHTHQRIVHKLKRTRYSYTQFVFCCRICMYMPKWLFAVQSSLGRPT